VSNDKRAHNPNGDDTEREIFMLKNMQISGVALVPRGANNRFFVLAKNAAGDQRAMKINPAVKAAALPAIRECVDKVSSMYALVSGAEEDASAEDASELASFFKMLSEETGQYADKFGKKKKPPAEMDKTADAEGTATDAATAVDKAGKKFSSHSKRQIDELFAAAKALKDAADEAHADGTPPPATNASASNAGVAKSIERAVADGVQAGVAAALAASLAKAAPAPPAPASETQTRVITPPSGIEQGSGAGAKPPTVDLFAAADFGAAYTRHIASTGKN
jgi:hypothetical protein